jgi:hypothetical protein
MKAIIAAKTKAWQQKNRDRIQRVEQKRRGLPEPTRPRPESCECCGGHNDSGQKLHLDHCHGKNVFRGWLCFRCNMGLGYFKDDPERLRRAIAYLDQFTVSLAECQTQRDNRKAAGSSPARHHTLESA